MKGDIMDNKQQNINSKALSIEESLLLSALLCGVTPESPFIHRLQLFFCANFVVGKDNAEEDFQRCIETEVDILGDKKYWLRADRGVYELTLHGYSHAKHLFPNITPQSLPADNIAKVNYRLSGKYNNEDLFFERRGRQFTVTIGNELFTNIKDVCRHLGFSTEDRSAPRILYNLAIRNKFQSI
jgi:hypothetical protein